MVEDEKIQDKQVDLSLLERTLVMIAMAKRMGFDNSISPVMFEAWMPPEEIFCNTACSVVAWWLRKRHHLKTWVELEDDKWYGYLQYFGVSINDKKGHETYEIAMLEIINVALNALPDANQNKTTTGNKPTDA